MELPTGTVTFLFTDIEGSTRLLAELGEEYAGTLAEHRRLLRRSFERHCGVEVDTQGDAFFVAFSQPSDALAAAEEAQRALAGGQVRVRMGLHTGEATVTDEGYVGIDVHRAARIAAAAHGGQVVLSKETHALVEDAFPLLDLGEHRVKDFAEPVWLFQLGREQFAPLKTISNTNLLRPASSFVGRKREVDDLVSLLLHGARLVTLSGPGGSGKTRLAIEAAAELVPEFRNGVFFVALSSLSDPDLVLESVAQTLGSRGDLAEHIGERELLLLLDNFEQVVGAAVHVGSLVEASPNLRVLVTSRELLRVRGEVEYAVMPLVESDAVALFCERSRLRADKTIAELCRRLDSLPLAIELAAARASVLSPRQILERLSQCLDILQGGRDAEARQQTLRATIEWSYDLLTQEEQRLFARLAVFSGGCTLDAAEAICGAELDTLQSLVHKSLLRFSQERAWMLETIHEYALERLEESGEDTDLRRAHAHHFLAVVEEAALHLDNPREQERWLTRLDADQGNLRAALAWSRDVCEHEVEIRLATSLREFWFARGYYLEGLRWLDTAIEQGAGERLSRLKALRAAADLASKVGDFASARCYADQGLVLARDAQDHAAIADLLRVLASDARQRGDAEEDEAHLADGLAHARAAGDLVLVGRFLTYAGIAALESGQLQRARQLLREALDVSTTAESAPGIGRALGHLGTLALLEDNLEEALGLYRKVLPVAVDYGFREGVAYVLAGLSYTFARRGENERAIKLLGAESRLAGEAHLRRERHHGELCELTAAAMHERLSADSMRRLLSEGTAMSLDEVVELALADSVERSRDERVPTA